MQEERKAPIPRQAAAQAQIGSAGNLATNVRGSSKNLQEMQEERKVGRANLGAQVIANNRNTARAQA